MARKNLLDTLKEVEKRIYKNSQSFRSLVSDRKAHSVTVDKKDLIFQITAEMQFRLGTKTLPDSMVVTIEREVTKMVRHFYVALHPNKFNTDRKSYETSGIHGSKTSFSVVYAAKNPLEDRKVFQSFKTLKQRIQKPLLAALNADISALNKGKRKGNRFSNINAAGAGFLDIGHGDDSSVSLQRRKVVNEALFSFDTSKNPLAQKFLGELRDNLKLVATKRDSKSSDVISISLESKNINRDSFSKGEVSDLNRSLKKEIERLGASYWANQEGSDSRATKMEKQIITDIVTPIKGKKKVTRAKKGKVQKSKSSIVKSRGRKTKASMGAAFKDTTKVATKKRNVSKGIASAPMQMLGAINNQLPETVRENMQTPRLQNRTGRFANSVRVTDIAVTNTGLPSVGYTYDRGNYGQYEKSSGSRWADTDRDPRTLIDKSIREIAAGLAIGRFFTRRV